MARDEIDELEEEEDGGDADFLMKWESLLILRGDERIPFPIFMSLFPFWCS